MENVFFTLNLEGDVKFKKNLEDAISKIKELNKEFGITPNQVAKASELVIKDLNKISTKIDGIGDIDIEVGKVDVSGLDSTVKKLKNTLSSFDLDENKINRFIAAYETGIKEDIEFALKRLNLTNEQLQKLDAAISGKSKKAAPTISSEFQLATKQAKLLDIEIDEIGRSVNSIKLDGLSNVVKSFVTQLASGFSPENFANNISNLLPEISLTNTALATGVQLAIQLGQEITKAVANLFNLEKKIQGLTTLRGEESQRFAERVAALTNTLNVETDTIIVAANKIAKNRKLTIEDSITFIEKALTAGVSEKVIEQVAQADAVYRDAGLNIAETTGLIQKSVEAGFEPERFTRAFKNANIKFLQFSEETQKGFQKIFKGQDFLDIKKLRDELEGGKKSTAEAFEVIFQKSKKLNLTNQQLTLLGSLLGGDAVEDAGAESFLKLFDDLANVADKATKAQNDFAAGNRAILESQKELQTALGRLSRPLEDLDTNFTILKNKSFKAVVKAFTPIFELLNNYFNYLTKQFTYIFDQIIDPITDIAIELGEVFKVAVSPIVALFEAIWDGATMILESIFPNFRDAFSKVANSGSIAVKIINFISTSIRAAVAVIELYVSILRSFWDTIRNIFDTILSNVRSFISLSSKVAQSYVAPLFRILTFPFRKFFEFVVTGFQFLTDKIIEFSRFISKTTGIGNIIDLKAAKKGIDKFVELAKNGFLRVKDSAEDINLDIGVDGKEIEKIPEEIKGNTPEDLKIKLKADLEPFKQAIKAAKKEIDRLESEKEIRVIQLKLNVIKEQDLLDQVGLILAEQRLNAQIAIKQFEQDQKELLRDLQDREVEQRRKLLEDKEQQLKEINEAKVSEGLKNQKRLELEKLYLQESERITAKAAEDRYNTELLIEEKKQKVLDEQNNIAIVNRIKAFKIIEQDIINRINTINNTILTTNEAIAANTKLFDIQRANELTKFNLAFKQQSSDLVKEIQKINNSINEISDPELLQAEFARRAKIESELLQLSISERLKYNRAIFEIDKKELENTQAIFNKRKKEIEGAITFTANAIVKLSELQQKVSGVITDRNIAFLSAFQSQLGSLAESAISKIESRRLRLQGLEQLELQIQSAASEAIILSENIQKIEESLQNLELDEAKRSELNTQLNELNTSFEIALEKQKELQKQYSEALKENSKITLIELLDFTQQASTAIINSINSALDSQLSLLNNSIELQKKKIDELNNTLQSGNSEAANISTKQIQIEKDRLTELEKQRKDFLKRQQSLQIAQLAIDAALAIGRVFATTPPPLSFALAALTAGSFVAQILALRNKLKSLPTAEGGAKVLEGGKIRTYKNKDSGVIQGRSHKQGGVLIEVEDGEHIFSKKQSSTFGELFEAIHTNKVKSIKDLPKVLDLDEKRVKFVDYSDKYYKFFNSYHTSLDYASIENRLERIEKAIIESKTQTNVYFDERGLYSVTRRALKDQNRYERLSK